MAPKAASAAVQACLTFLLASGLLLVPAAALAVSAVNLPSAPPPELVLDTAAVLSRSASAELGSALLSFDKERVEAHLITIKRLDYGLDLETLANRVLEGWLSSGAPDNQLLFLIETQTNAATVTTSPGLAGLLNQSLLSSTGRTTIGQPIRDGGRYRQGSLDGINRLLTVLQGGEDPGEPVVAEVAAPVTNIPTQEETSQGNGFKWVIVLLVAGTIVPMLTWWVFSR